MIVQRIEISMSKGRAADILAHVGEEGREIEFIPDVELSADDHTAEIDTVKPDGTFTMTNCNIDENGHIIAPIIEQAVAVKGLCHYIIKIYNDDLVIYSACGSLWVDDHLITDDMIESVAEVNGYRFPQDFLTNDDLAAMIDDNEIVSDKTWSSQKINDEISSINVLHDYSTTEKVIGTWINGKPVYEVSYERNTAMSSGDTVITNLMPDCETVVDLRALLHHFVGTIPIWTLLPVDDNNATIYGDGNNVKINLSTSYANYRANAGCLVVVQFTKTTD